MGKNKPVRPSDAGRKLGEKMAEQFIMQAMSGDAGKGDEPERPKYCGECGFFEPAGSVPGSDGDSVCWTQAPVCQMEPPQVIVVQTNVFNGVEPITRAERLACRHGIKKI